MGRFRVAGFRWAGSKQWLRERVTVSRSIGVIGICAFMLLQSAFAATLPGTVPAPAKPKAPAPSLRVPVTAPALTAPADTMAGAPNLLVEGVTWRPPIIREGVPIHFDFRVRNAGTAAAPASNTIVYRDGTATTTQALPALAAGASSPGSAVVEARCGATVTVRADAPNQIRESNESDNAWSMTLSCPQVSAAAAAPKMTSRATAGLARKATTVPPASGGGSSGSTAPPANCSPDLYVRRVEIDPPYPRAFQDYRIHVWALQLYPDSLPQAPESFVSVHLAGHSTAIDSQYVRFANGNTAEPDFQWTRADTGAKSLELRVRMDHLNTLSECNEANNEFVYPYTVYAENEKMADLAFKGYVQFPMHNLVNRDVDLSGTLINKGNAESRPFWLEFDCDDDRDAGTRLKHRVRISSLIAPAGGMAAFNTRIRWSTPGMKVCMTRLDVDGEVIESDERNNEYVGVTVRVDNPPPVQ
jgi:hypothetical protein